MDFYPNQLFHIYNQGNNQRQTFFEEENYHYFLWKMRAYLPLFGDLIAWCLMPNHFHWQFYVKNVSVDRKEVYEYVDQVEYERRVKKYGSRARPVQRDWTRVASLSKEVKLNDAIGDLLKSYTQALNNQMGFSGGLWLKPCKATM
jgi:putative transposase